MTTILESLTDKERKTRKYWLYLTIFSEFIIYPLMKILNAGISGSPPRGEALFTSTIIIPGFGFWLIISWVWL